MPGGTRADRVAEAVGMSGRTYEKAKEVLEAAEQQPEQFAEVVEEMNRSGRVDPAFRKVREKKTAKQTRSATKTTKQTAKKAKAATKTTKQTKTVEGSPAAAPATPATAPPVLPDASITRTEATRINQFLGELSPRELAYTVRTVFNKPTCLNLSTEGLDRVLICVRKKAPELSRLVCRVLKVLTGPEAGDDLMLFAAVAALNPANRSELLAELCRDQAERQRQAGPEGRARPAR